MLTSAVMAAASFSSFFELIGVLIIFLFILVMTYFTTKWLAGYQKGKMFQTNLKVVETLKITTNKYIQIVQAGDEFLVIAIGKDEICLLSKLSREQLKEFPAGDVAETGQPENFKDILDKWKQHVQKK